MAGKYSNKIIWLLLGLAVLILAAAPPLAAQPPTKPILRIEAGMHTATIKRAATDAAGRYLATASDDKTIRVWDLASGRLLRVLRPPIGHKQEGKLFAVAMSPDGELVACGGWSQDDDIYIMERSSGRLAHRISGLPNVIKHLAWSRDGRYLAASVGGKNGIRVYETNGWSLVGQDRDYQGDSYGVAFDRSNRLAATCYDGYVRLYDASFRQVAKVKAPGGKWPYGVAFSPDGSKVAVGYDDSTRVDVFSGQDLRHLYSPDTSRLKKRQFVLRGLVDGWRTPLRRRQI